MKIKVDELQEKVETGVNLLGYEGIDAQTITDILMYAQLRDNNQGITKIATGGIAKASEVEPFKVEKVNKCAALLSGGLGMLTTKKAVSMAAELAEKHGVGIVCSTHTFTSTGAIGWYARQIAEAGYIGLICIGTPPVVAPFGSNEAKLGTNPISYAFPTHSQTVVFDTTTAAMAYFGVVEARLNGEQLPEGIAYDVDGNITLSPKKALEGGSIATFAGHKGYGLSVLAQMLGGPFSGGWFLGNNKEQGNGIFALAIDPGLITNKTQFLAQADILVEQLQQARPTTADGRVFLPGERGDKIAQMHKEHNEIEIADAVWQELCNFIKAT